MQIAALWGKLVKCHSQLGNLAAKGKPFNEALCEDRARHQYDTAIAKFIAACPACVGTNVASMRDQAESFVDARNGDVYCVP